MTILDAHGVEDLEGSIAAPVNGEETANQRGGGPRRA
jgi:hypothetical protein